MEAKEESLSFEVSLNQFADLSPKELAVRLSACFSMCAGTHIKNIYPNPV